MGRLHKQKGFDLLIRAFASVANIDPRWELIIWGEGPERMSLERLRSSLGLDRRVQMPGIISDVWRGLRSAEIFVLSSRFEGFPNALCEAMAAGLAVVATDCRSGPADIIRDGIDGLLVPPEDFNALAKAMHMLMIDRSLREKLGSESGEVSVRFSPEKIMAMWERVMGPELQNLVTSGPRGLHNGDH